MARVRSDVTTSYAARTPWHARERCVATVDPAPRYAVPDVDGLGPLPNTAAALEAYEHRLDLVGGR